MATDLEMGRPNIRIEIKNASTEPMDVDENERSEEEGEIRDHVRNLKGSNDSQSDNENVMKSEDIFRRGIDILNSIDQTKLQERAKRFALKPEEISTFTDQNLQNLYKSLGMSSNNADQVRFEAIHVRSSREISVRNIILYFIKYAPTTIEKVDQESYNVVWEDVSSTARTLFHISQVVRGMPVRNASEHVIDNFILEEESENVTDRSLLNENRQIELREDSVEETDKSTSESSVDISDINIPIPPGYWRLGKKPINSFSVLMRFSLKIDKKPYQIEKCNKYFKNLSLTNINENKYKGIFSRNKEISKEVHDKDPWGILAKNWDEDLVFREREHYTHAEPSENMTNLMPENPELRIRLAAKRRLGKKQVQEESITISASEKEQSDESEQEIERKATKMPRMRMYADEEEEKIKRKKLLLTLKKQTEKLKKTEIPNSDLRNILRITNNKPRNIQHNDDVDLSVNLKNRGRKLVFTVSQEGSRTKTEKRLIKDRLDKPRVISPGDRKPISPIRFKRNESPQKEKQRSVREHHRERKRLSSPVRRRESRRSSDRRFEGRMYSSKRDENYYVQKPKSKVALVIKTQKKPSVASTIRSRNRKFDSSSSSSSEEDSSSEESSSDSSEEGSEDTSSSSSEDSESNTSGERKHRSQGKMSKVPLKVEIKNDQYKRKIRS